MDRVEDYYTLQLSYSTELNMTKILLEFFFTIFYAYKYVNVLVTYMYLLLLYPLPLFSIILCTNVHFVIHIKRCCKARDAENVLNIYAFKQLMQ